jgi:hypothetical protein
MSPGGWSCGAVPGAVVAGRVFRPGLAGAGRRTLGSHPMGPQDGAKIQTFRRSSVWTSRCLSVPSTFPGVGLEERGPADAPRE